MKNISKKSFLLGFLTFFILSNLLSAINVNAFFIAREYTRDEKIEKLLGLLDKYYLNEYNEDELYESMYEGLVKGVDDPYTSYMSSEIYTDFKQKTNGSYAGIGSIVTTSENNKVEISLPFEGSPAYEAGLKPGDQILKVNGVEVFGDKLDEATNMIKGIPGTVVELEVLKKESNEKVNLKIVRRNITIPSVKHEMLDDKNGYIAISGFDEQTDKQYFEAFEDLKNQGMEGLIIDLRNNPGGSLGVVVNIADSIVPEGTVVYSEDKYGKKNYYNSDADHIDIPLVIIMNENSASASEVLAGAVRDHNIGEIVGEQSYGKGVVQSLHPVGDGSAIKITVSNYYSPKGISIHGKGLVPDYVVEVEDDFAIVEKEDDTQLLKAIEVLNTKK